MASSEQDKQVDSSFDDDLDKMLQDTADQMGDDQDILDSDEAIDRLLGDSQGGEVLDEDIPESVDDLVDSLLGGVDNQERKADLSDEEIDEFADDPVELEAFSGAVSEPSSVLTEDEMGAFADDLLSEQGGIDSAIQEKPNQEAGVTESMAEIDEFSSDVEDDFLLADFDISADDDEFKEEEVELSAPDRVEQVAVVPEPEVVPERVAAGVVSEPSKSVVAIDDQSEKIAQIESELADLKSGLNFSEALGKITKDQKKANRELDEANKKLKVWSVGALVISVIALVIGITVVVLNSGVQSSVERVQGSVMDIEDRLEVPAIKLVDPNNAKIEELQFNVQSLQAFVNDMPERLNALQGQLNSINTDEIQQVMDKQLININEKLVALEVEVASLKGGRARAKASSRKVVKRVAVQEWVVNLVSFKQRWYTDKKVQEYKQKGIPAEVVSVDVRGVEWFRVRVPGFKGKAEAAAYAIKMKKSLNLNSVWVSKK
jgi:TolA-binding protein